MGTKTLANGKTVETYPLTQAQRFMFFAWKQFSANTPFLFISSGYYWKDDFRADLLKEALEEAIARCDSLRIRYTLENVNGNMQVMQYIDDDAETPVEEVDLSGMPYEESYRVMKGWAKELQPVFDCPVNTIRLIRLSDGLNGFFMRFNHLSFDGYASKAFIVDTMAIYLHKKCGTPYPKPMRSYYDAMMDEFKYLDSDQRKADRAYWMKLFSTMSEPIFNDYLIKDNRLKKAQQENPGQRCVALYEGDHPETESLTYQLSKEDSDLIMDMCKEKGLSVPCVLMLGLRTALSAFNDNQEDVSFKFMINRRGSLLSKKAYGNRWHFYSLRTIIPPQLTFEQAVAAVEDAQSEVFKHCNFDTLEMYQVKHIAMKQGAITNAGTMTYDTMTFSYHAPQEVPCESDEVRATCIGVWYPTDFSAQNLYLTIKHRASDNGLEFNFDYRTSENSLEDLKVFYPKIVQAIMTGVKNPQITIGEILDIIKL